VIVVLDEGPYLGFEITLQIVVLQQDAVLQGLTPALDLSLGLRMVGCAETRLPSAPPVSFPPVPLFASTLLIIPSAEFRPAIY
jgi:hypothetical protein